MVFVRHDKNLDKTRIKKMPLPSKQKDSVCFENTPSLKSLKEIPLSFNKTTSLVPRSWNRYNKCSIVRIQLFQNLNYR